MRIIRQDIDSNVFGQNFMEIFEYSNEISFDAFEKNYIKEHNPYYVCCKIPIEEIESINFLEKNGFNFIEIQIREKLILNNSFKPSVFQPYLLQLINTKEDLDKVLSIVNSTFKHDRILIDPLLIQNKSGERYQQYLIKSYSQKDERICKLFNSITEEILGFVSYKVISDDEVLILLGGIDNKYKKTPLPIISGNLLLTELYKKGIKKFTTHVSGNNYGVLNLEIKEFGSKIVQVFVVLRKIYQ